MEIKSEEELKSVLASALRAYSYQVGTGRGLDIYLPMLEGKSATVTFTLEGNGTLIASAAPTVTESTEYETVKEQLKDCQKTVKEQTKTIEEQNQEIQNLNTSLSLYELKEKKVIEEETIEEPVTTKRRKRS